MDKHSLSHKLTYHAGQQQKRWDIQHFVGTYLDLAQKAPSNGIDTGIKWSKTEANRLAYHESQQQQI